MSAPLTQSVICPILIGRVAQLGAVADLAAHAARGQSRVAVSAGEAGIGKSRLVAEARTLATQRGFIILQGHCFEQDRAFPYAPLLDLLRVFIAARSSEELARDLGDTALAAIDEGTGDVYYARGEYPPAAEAYQRSVGHARSAAARARLKGKIGAAYTWYVDERGQEFLEAALNELNPETQANDLARAMVWLGRFYWNRMQYTRSLELCERARQLAERIDDANTLTWI